MNYNGSMKFVFTLLLAKASLGINVGDGALYLHIPSISGTYANLAPESFDVHKNQIYMYI